MTKKDYTLVAEALAKSRPIFKDTYCFIQWRHDVEYIAYALARDNPQFDLSKFYAAAEKGLSEDERTK